MAPAPPTPSAHALWLAAPTKAQSRGPSEAALAAYVKRIAHINALQWLEVEQASWIIESLKHWQEGIDRAARSRPSNRPEAKPCPAPSPLSACLPKQHCGPRVIILQKWRAGSDPIHRRRPLPTNHERLPKQAVQHLHDMQRVDIGESKALEF